MGGYEMSKIQKAKWCIVTKREGDETKQQT